MILMSMFYVLHKILFDNFRKKVNSLWCIRIDFMNVEQITHHIAYDIQRLFTDLFSAIFLILRRLVSLTYVKTNHFLTSRV